MLKAIIIIVILTWAYLVYLLIRLHMLINRAHKEMDMPKEPWDDDPMMKLLRSKATFDGQSYAEAAPEPESTEEAIQNEFGPRPEESQKMYDKQLGYEMKAHAYLNPDLHPNLKSNDMFTAMQDRISDSISKAAKELNSKLESQVRQNAIPPITGKITKEALDKRGIKLISCPYPGKSFIAQTNDGKERRISDYF